MGVLPNDMVVFRVPVVSCRILCTTGDLEPRGLDFGEYCSPLVRLTSVIIIERVDLTWQKTRPREKLARI